MFNIFRRKRRVRKDMVNSRVVPDMPPIVVQARKEDGKPTHMLMHCCCTLTPEALESLARPSKLPLATWYKALWFVQHQPGGIESMTVHALANEVGVSWPTAQLMYKKITRVLDLSHRMD